jgi:hypothetical protein
MVVMLVALTLLHGTVRIGPTTPVCRAGVPCDKPAGRVVLTFTHGTSRVRVRTDADGRYRVRLVPGTWRLRTSVGMRATPITFVVPRTATATRNFSIDTGIR